MIAEPKYGGCNRLAQIIEADRITTDSWYGSKQNLKFFREKGLDFGVGLAKNRSVLFESGNYGRIDSLEIPENGKILELKGFGEVKVFKRVFKKSQRNYRQLV